MFGRQLVSRAARNIAVAGQQRQFTGISSTLYKNVWKKSNVMYITYVVIGCVVVEGVYGSITNFIWESANYGKLYHHIDWSKFKSEDDEESDE